jgi:hypothetical protein
MQCIHGCRDGRASKHLQCVDSAVVNDGRFEPDLPLYASYQDEDEDAVAVEVHDGVKVDGQECHGHVPHIPSHVDDDDGDGAYCGGLSVGICQGFLWSLFL